MSRPANRNPKPSLISTLLPDAVASVEAFGDVAAPPHAEELPLVARALPARRREFATGRWCAREALRRLGIAPEAILADERGAPRWPAAVVGSISHCRGYRACAVARTDAFRSLGIDAEPNEPLSPLAELGVAAADERRHLARLAAIAPTVCWPRLLFCAKESFYKAHHQINREPFGYDAARVWIEPAGSAFAVQLRAPDAPAPRCLEGRWCLRDGLLLAAVAVAA